MEARGRLVHGRRRGRAACGGQIEHLTRERSRAARTGRTADPTPGGPPSGASSARYVPIVTWLPAYDRADLRFDAIAGIVSWGVMVPVAMAYAGLAGMPPETGLVTAFAALAAYAVFGTSRHLKVTTSSSVAILSASVVGAILSSQDPASYIVLERRAGADRRDHPRRGRRGATRVPLPVPGDLGGDRVRDRTGRHDHHRPVAGPARAPAGQRHDVRAPRRRGPGDGRPGRPDHRHPRHRLARRHPGPQALRAAGPRRAHRARSSASSSRPRSTCPPRASRPSARSPPASPSRASPTFRSATWSS